jgi:signal transduction histidine kinase
MHAFDTRQSQEQKEKQRLRWLTALTIAAVPLGGLWAYYFLQRERRRELEHYLGQQQVDRAKRTTLELELQRREAEHKREEAERKALQLKSQLYASISIMAGSYAHNIKNILVRPNDLLDRCLESTAIGPDVRRHIEEIQETLHSVTGRLQQLLRTLQRDPTKSEPERLDLNGIVKEICATWEEIAREKWRVSLTAEPFAEALWVDADRSHLIQAVENLLFNSRDAVYEMRNHLREEARRNQSLDEERRRQAVIAAAGWKGEIVVRTRAAGETALLEVVDDGIGMTDQVREHCAEPYFSTKRNNALHQGNAAGMGLGLSFVQTVLEHHHAKIEIESVPFHGATVRLAFCRLI